MTITHDNDIVLLTAQIKHHRERLGLTQTQVAERAGIRQANYSRMESGRQAPNLETLFSVLDVLGLELSLSDASQTIFHIMYLDRVVTDVILSRDRKNIKFKKYERDGIYQPFSGKILNMERFFRFLKSRCYEDGRSDLDVILSKAHLQNNNPYDWIKITHGVTFEDFFWVKMGDEQVTWDEVRIR